MNKKERLSYLQGQIDLLKDICENHLYGHCVGDIGLVGIINEKELKKMIKEKEKILKDKKDACDFCTVRCGNSWCHTAKKGDKNDKRS